MVDQTAFVESRVARVLTQYRESPRLLAVARHGLAQRAEAAAAIEDIPTHFNLLTAKGDQLTIIGKWLGFPRCHCVCVSPPIIGFPCPPDQQDPNVEIVDFCDPDGVFDGCYAGGTGDVCLTDDEVYRTFLLVRRYQLLGRYQLVDLEAACRLMWGENTILMSQRPGAICVLPRRALTGTERLYLPLAFRVLPVAPGISTYMHFGTRPLIGFGAGWATLCDDADFLCAVRVDPYSCN